MLVFSTRTLASFKENKNNSINTKSSVVHEISQPTYSSSEPKFPFDSGPRQYQLDAYNNWKDKDYQGIFAMATGTGKTITSLNCVLEEYNINKQYYIFA